MPNPVVLTRSLPFLLLLLAGCEQLGIEGPAQEAAAREAEGRAVGSACRHSGRALEDCYALNAKALKAAVFTGWRDMDAYMRDNGIESVQPKIDPAAAKKKKPVAEEPAAKTEESAAKAEAPVSPKENGAQSATEKVIPPAAGAKKT